MGRGVAVVLFTDLVGSTELRGRLGEEAAEDLRRRHDQLLAQAVEANNGRVVKSLGDGIMATFGGASDAVAAAVAIQQWIDRLNRSAKAGVPVEVRVGLSAGDVAFEDDDVHGTPVIEAARLCAAAVGGEILASEIVRWLGGSQGASLTPVGSLELKGLAAPVPAVRVEWEPAPASTIPMPALLTGVGRIFVGRDAELERLGELWKEAAAGERRVALLAGEPGVGKTRLAAALADRVHEEGGVVLAGRCDEDMGVPYQPFVEALRHFVDHTRPVDLKDRLGRYGGELVRLVSELAERVPDLAPPLHSDPETERYRLFDAVAAWLSAASVEDPLLVVLDDLQWAAKPTLLLLRHVARASDPRRLLILGTYRDTELTHDHPLVGLVTDLRRDGAVERLPLSGLDDVGVAAIVEQAAGHGLDEDGLALARAIYQETEGNPFFVREVLRHLVETNAIGQHDGRWSTQVPIEQLGIPEGVRDVVGHRLARLSEEANQTLRVAAVIGADFDASLLHAAAGFPDSAVVAALDEAIQARLVTEISPTRFQFAHVLIRVTLYESLTGPRKRALHRQVAEASETLYERALDDHLPALAHHWARASTLTTDKERATDYAARAGDRALAQLAHDEAVAYYREALELLESTGEDLHTGRRVAFLISLGEAQRRAGDATHRETLLTAGRLALQLGDGEAAARAALANQRGALASRLGEVDPDRVDALKNVLEAIGPTETPLRAQLLAALANELYFACDDRRRELGRQALMIARQHGDARVLAQVLATVWFATWDPGAVEERDRLVTEFSDLAERLNDRSLQFHAGFARFVTASEQGDMGRADATLESSAAIAEELGQPLLRWRVAIMRVHRATSAGRPDDAERLIEESVRLGELAGQPDARFAGAVPLAIIQHVRGRPEQALPTWEAFAAIAGVPGIRCLLALAYAELGRVEDARTIITALLRNRFADIPRDHIWLPSLCAVARASARVGHVEAAEKLYDILRPHQRQVALVTTAWFGVVSHDLGILAGMLGEQQLAEMHFRHAAELQERIGAVATLAHTRLEWARVLCLSDQLRDKKRARTLLQQAVAVGRELGLPGVEHEATRLLG